MILRDYNNPAYKKWRQDVYKRDHFQCRWPGCKNKRPIHAHHIKRWADLPALRFDIRNGITLCKMHHQFIKNREVELEGFFYKILCI